MEFSSSLICFENETCQSKSCALQLKKLGAFAHDTKFLIRQSLYQLRVMWLTHEEAKMSRERCQIDKKCRKRFNFKNLADNRRVHRYKWLRPKIVPHFNK